MATETKPIPAETEKLAEETSTDLIEKVEEKEQSIGESKPEEKEILVANPDEGKSESSPTEPKVPETAEDPCTLR